MLGRSEITVLGEVSHTEITRVASWANRMTDGRLDIVEPKQARFLAGWSFDYPDHYYHRLPEVLREIPRHIQTLNQAGIRVEALPLIVRLVAGLEEASNDAASLRLTSLRETLGLTKLSATAFALVELVRAAGGDESAQPDRIMRLLFPAGRHGPLRNFPLLRFDPEEHVFTMVTAIAEVWSTSSVDLKRFRRFKVSGSGIFQGAEDNGAWVTILAYCGGWRTVPPIARCGAAPLVLGRNATCPTCHHLICSNCAYCGQLCPDCAPRQGRASESTLK
jgi:hypothetical protein